ncbi:MAG: hypothetical protein COA99_18255 [Moraxellaceae bacterium]|nr:MAG: hypothetical protein COA99_18255 [Moraxellaceae bacterium]
MNLDELVQSIADEEPESFVSLRKWINSWKDSGESIDDLNILVSKWHGNVWFKSKSISDEFNEQWTKFKTIAIDGIGGLTLNERLYWFGMFDSWDNADEHDKLRIRIKLKANT